jgi:hypothetical protein
MVDTGTSLNRAEPLVAALLSLQRFAGTNHRLPPNDDCSWQRSEEGFPSIHPPLLLLLLLHPPAWFGVENQPATESAVSSIRVVHSPRAGKPPPRHPPHRLTSTASLGTGRGGWPPSCPGHRVGRVGRAARRWRSALLEVGHLEKEAGERRGCERATSEERTEGSYSVRSKKHCLCRSVR